MGNYDYALFKRGFVFSDESIESPIPTWKNEVLIYKNAKPINIFYDPDVAFAHKENDIFRCFIIGYAMDTNEWHMEIDLICDKLLENLTKSLNDFYEYLDCLNGRFVIGFGDDQNLNVLNDAMALRSVYYHLSRHIVSSHYEIIKRITNDDYEPYFFKYQKIERNKPWMLPGDMTPYQNIRILLPNHEFNFYKNTIRRFFPRENHTSYTFKEAMDVLPKHLKKQMETLAKYKTPILSITAGNDSRVTMSATKEIRNKCVYFSYATGSTNETSSKNQINRKKDRDYAEYITSLYGLNFKLIELEHPIDQEMVKIANINHHHRHIMGAIEPYIEIQKSTGDTGIHLRSCFIEVIRDLTFVYAESKTEKPSIDLLAGWMTYWAQRNELRDYLKDFFERIQFDDIYDYENMRMFYWEHRVPTWICAAVVVENDIAFDTYILLNCRNLIKFGFSMSQFLLEKNMITKYIVKELWPELLFKIENSPDTLFDYYEIDSCNKIETKNLDTKTNKENMVFIPNKFGGGLITFDTFPLKCGDFIELILPYNKEVDNYAQFLLSSSERNLVPFNKAEFYVKIDNKIIFKDDYAKLAKNTKFFTLDLSLYQDSKIICGIRVLEDIFNKRTGINPVLNIESIRFSENPFLDQEEQKNGVEYMKKNNFNLQNDIAIQDIYPQDQSFFIDENAEKIYQEKYTQFYRSNINVLDTNKNPFITIDKNTRDLPTGCFNVLEDNVRLDCFYYDNKKNSESLYVQLNGFLDAKYPQFKRWSYSSFVNGAILNIADPMYYYNKNLKLGWYYGTNTTNYRIVVADFIKKILKLKNIKNENLYFIASSGGGTAAIEVASYFENSTAIIINPQIHLDKTFYTEEFIKQTGINLLDKDKWDRNNLSHYLLNSPKTKFLLFQNIASKEDLDNSLSIAKKLKMNLKIGIQKNKNIAFWMYYAKTNMPHGAQDSAQFFFALDYLAKNFDKSWDNIQSLYLFFTELWNQHFKLVNNNENLKESTKDELKHDIILTKVPCEKLIYANPKIKIEKKDNIYNSVVLNTKLEPFSEYVLKIGDAICLEGNAQTFTIGIKDNNRSYVISQNDTHFGNNIEFSFITHDDVSKFDIKLYAGKILQTNNISVEFRDLKLFKINDLIKSK